MNHHDEEFKNILNKVFKKNITVKNFHIQISSNLKKQLFTTYTLYKQYQDKQDKQDIINLTQSIYTLKLHLLLYKLYNVKHVVQYGGYIIDHMKKYYKQRRLTHQIKNIERHHHYIGISDVQKTIKQYKDEIQKLIKPVENDISILYGMCYKYLSKYIEYINSIDISYSPDENQFSYNSRSVLKSDYTKNYYTIKFYIEFMVSFIEQLVDLFISTLIAKPSIQKYEEKLIIEDELNFQKLYLSYLHETDMFAVNKSTSKSKASPQINNSNKSSNEIPRGYNIIKTDKGYKLGNTFGGKPRRRSKTSKAL
jgi:hypothetical protein